MTDNSSSRSSDAPGARRLLVCGGRDFTDRDFIWNSLCDLWQTHGPFSVVMHGDATGADSEAEFWAEAHKIKTLPMRAEWERYGKSAGPRRNQRLIEQGRPDLVAAFPGGRGAADMVGRARAANVPVIEFAPKRRTRAAHPAGMNQS